MEGSFSGALEKKSHNLPVVGPFVVWVLTCLFADLTSSVKILALVLMQLIAVRKDEPRLVNCTAAKTSSRVDPSMGPS